MLPARTASSILRTIRRNSVAFQQSRQVSHFEVKEHIVKCQHTRERPAGAELGRENDLVLHVKQYIPKDHLRATSGDVTLIGAHGNGFPKEIHEPMWDDLYESLRAKGRTVRAVWIADMVGQGRSGILNEDLLGPDTSWWDHSRDMLFLMNQFQDQMPHPIVGVGHSMGATQLAYLSLLHPRLLDALVMIDPVIQLENPSKTFAPASTYRKDCWVSRKTAAMKFASSKFYQKWDPRVLDQWIQYGLRDLPPEQYAEFPQDISPDGPPVVLTTTKASEVHNYLRPAYHDARLLQPDGPVARDMAPADIDPTYPFYRPEPVQMFRRLPELSPHVLYICGRASELAATDVRAQRLTITGTGVGGNGGAARGGVREVMLDGGHLVPMEQTRECAEAGAAFIDGELARWEEEERGKKRVWEGLTRRERIGINELWKQHIGGPATKRPKDG